jgi:hypothetical protein
MVGSAGGESDVCAVRPNVCGTHACRGVEKRAELTAKKEGTPKRSPNLMQVQEAKRLSGLPDRQRAD